MSAGDARHGRRDNGLVAAEYAPAGDVDPRVGEHLLDVLALDGIAAYLRPSTDLHPVTRSTLLPSRPTDRLYVDRAHVATARDYLTRLARDAEHDGAPDDVQPTDEVREPAADSTDGGSGQLEPTAPTANPRPAPSNDDVDRAWAEIIAGYDATAPTRLGRTDPSGPPSRVGDDGPGKTARPGSTRPDPKPDLPRPDQRPEPGHPERDRTREDNDRDRIDRDRTDPDRTDPDRTDRGSRGYRSGQHSGFRPSDEPSLLDGLDTFGADLPDDGESTFTPPVAPPVPRPSLPTALAVIGVVGGLAVFLKPELLSFLSNSLAMFLGFAAIVSGFGTLVWRLRPGDEDDDDPDNGARV